MTIFRYSMPVLALFLAACNFGSKPLPDPSTPLGKIARIHTFAERSKELKRFTETRLSDPKSLHREFVAAGFVPSRFKSQQGVECQSFDWKSDEMFPVIMLVNICGQEVFANSGQQAP